MNFFKGLLVGVVISLVLWALIIWGGIWLVGLLLP